VLRFDQLLPEPDAVEIGDQVARLRLADQAPSHRPYVVANFVASVDGRATFHGRSGQLGDDGDLAVFRALRREVDAVLAGTGTLRAEQYGRILKNPESRERRRRRGLSPEPLACMLTRRGDVPFDIPLFDEPEARVVVFTGVDVDASAVAAHVDVVRLPEAELSFATALGRLRADYDVRALLCEGGPSVLAALLREHVLDELFLTLAPKLTGGGVGPALTTGPELPTPAQLELAGVLERAGSLFLRYRVISEGLVQSRPCENGSYGGA
jgi:riboflavin biosynthesis pyrimidine reductase